MPPMSLAQIGRLLSWAENHGARLHERIKVYDDPDFGISLKVHVAKNPESLLLSTQPLLLAGDSLPPNSCIVSCPFKLSLSYLNALDTFSDLQAHSPQFPHLLFEVLEPHVIGHFFLIQQYINVETSHWGPYIKSLPQPEEHDKLGTPLYFTESDLAWIRGTNLEGARDQRELIWRTHWEKGRDILDSAPGWEESTGKWTWDLYKWAATIFSSRSFISTLIPKEVFDKAVDDRTTTASPSQDIPFQISKFHPENAFPVLFPLVDLANHSPTAQVMWFTNAHSKPQTLSIITESEIQEGDQIFNNYAPKSNTELLLGYGFCIPGNDEVALAFKVGNHSVDAKNQIFHVRRNPFARAESDRRLPEFAVFEDGCVNALAMLVANEREKHFLNEFPDRHAERGAERAFSGPLARNTLKVMSVLCEKLQTLFNKIVTRGEHLW